MGLDNFPHSYPCKSQGTAVMVQRKDMNDELVFDKDGSASMVISCEETQACGGCPYKTALDKQDKTLLGNPVYGMFGTDCWYRGKYGNYLMREIGYDGEYDFYGDGDEGTYKSPNGCTTVADVIDEAIVESDGNIITSLGDDITPELRYASWYLRWAAETCGGLVCWS